MIMTAQDIVELFCEPIAVRLPIIETQRECPLDLKEAVSSICFAAPKCPDLTELLQVPMMFTGKYGNKFVSAATELRPECGVNRQLVELLSVRAPTDVKLKLLKEIAEENDLDWDPSASETELFKPHKDLLFGPSQSVSGSKSTLEPVSRSTTADSVTEQSDSDSEYEIVDYPVVPLQPPHSNKGMVSTPEMLPFPASALSDSDDDEELAPQAMHEKSVSKQDSLLHETPHPVEATRFVPLTSPPSQSSGSFPLKENKFSHPIISKIDSDLLDLSDVLTAARDAAESAELASVAARSAASIAQFKFNELSMRKSDDDVSSSPIENPFFNHDELNSSVNEPAEYRCYLDSDIASTNSNQDNVADGDDDGTRRLPQRLPSMDDDDVHFSYPNLFSNLGSLSPSFTDSR